MFYDEPKVFFKLFEVFAFGHQVEGPKWTEISVFYLTNGSNQSDFLCQVPCYLYSSTFAGDFKTSKFLDHILALVFYLNGPILSSLW